MPANRQSPHKDPVFITMLAPGAIWQCALIPRLLRTDVIVHLADRYDGTSRSSQQSCPRRTRACSFTVLPQIDEARVHLQTSSLHGRQHLSGSIETRETGPLLWDIRLEPVCSGNQQHSLYRAEARLSASGQEILFPAKSSFLSIWSSTGTLSAAGCLHEPLNALLFDHAGGWVMTGGRSKPITSSCLSVSATGQVSLRRPDTDVALLFTADPLSVEQGLSVPLSSKRHALTQWGSWQSQQTGEPRAIPGFITSVI